VWWQVRPVRQRKTTPCPSAVRFMIDVVIDGYQWSR
jgi:hypothetical protein